MSKTPKVQKFAAFSNGEYGGNPAGVVIGDTLPSEAMMQAIAAEVGFSETAFATRRDTAWQVRYFSPVSEVPFCGHATIALGAALTLQEGDGEFPLILNDAEISVKGKRQGDLVAAALQSPPTRSQPAPLELVDRALRLFAYDKSDLNAELPPGLIHAGANHLMLALKTREALSAMQYELKAGRDLMTREALVTIMLVYAQTPRLFHVRNPFASGGVYEDPATGAAAAAFAGYLRDIEWPHGGTIEIVQGEDMGMRSLIHAQIHDQRASSVPVSGTARLMTD